MTIFEAVKSTVTPRMAAEHFGLNVSRYGMACCPFHDDRNPSMKLNEDYFYCFGCGAKAVRDHRIGGRTEVECRLRYSNRETIRACQTEPIQDAG